MKKLSGRKGTIHPTPPNLICDHHHNNLAFLPATILTLASALSSYDRQVLAYLISSSSGNNRINHPPKTTSTTVSGGGLNQDHPVSFNCYCFRCYMSYWVRWDTSPNRELIHEIIDAFEDGLLVQSSNSSRKREKTTKKQRRKSTVSRGAGCISSESDELIKRMTVFNMNLSKDVLSESSESVVDDNVNMTSVVDDNGEEDDQFEKGWVRKFMSLLGERVWSFWT